MRLKIPISWTEGAVKWSAFVHVEDGRILSVSDPVSDPPQDRSRGLGDTIAKATKAVGIKPCGGCRKRQEALNRLVPYGSR